MPRSDPPNASSDPGRGSASRRVAIASFRHAIEAHLALARLRSEGIDAALAGEHTAAVLVGVQSVQLVVDLEDAESARSLLAPEAPAARNQGSADWITDDLDAPRCPHCRSLRVAFDRLFLPLPGLRRQVRCLNCGARWREARG